MNVEKLSRLVRTCGKTKRQIAAECDISRQTLDTILAGGDVKVSTLEGLARAVGAPVGSLFDDQPSLSVVQTGDQNTVTGDTVRNSDPSLLSLIEERDRQMNRLIAVLESAMGLGKFSAQDNDLPEKR